MATAEFAVLCADRRVTRTTPSGALISQNDSDGKAFNFAGRSLVGFTGRARLDGLRMEPWVARALAGVNANDQRRKLADALTAEFDRAKHPTAEHAFLGVGFGQGSGRLTPEWWLVSNMVSSGGEVGPEFVDRGFRVFTWRNAEPSVQAVGFPIDPVLRDMANSAIANAIAADRTDPRPVMDTLHTVARHTAERSNGTVGSTFLICSLPRTMYGKTNNLTMHMGRLTDSQWRTEPVGIYLEHDFRGGNGFPQYFYPSVIDPGFTAVGMTYTAGPIDPTKVPDDGWRAGRG